MTGQSVGWSGGDPRERRAAGLISGDALGDGLELDQNGSGKARLKLDPKSGLEFTPQRRELTIKAQKGGILSLDGVELLIHKDRASGYAGLDASTQVLGTELGGASYGGAGTKVLLDTTPPTFAVISAGALMAHAPTHQHGGTDEVATATPGADDIPKALGTGKLAAGWVSEVLALADLTDVTATTGTGTTAVLSGAPVFSGAPTIPDFTNAQHDHSSASEGGALAGTTLTVSTTDRLLGRDSPGAGAVEEISLGVSLEFTGALSIQRAALTGDVTSAANSNALLIPNDTVTYAKIQNVTTARVLGRTTAGSGDVEELAAGTGITISGGLISATSAAETLALADLSDVTGKTGTGTIVVMQDTPTILTPTVASFVNANHSHLNAAGGGTLDAAAIASGTFALARITEVLALANLTDVTATTGSGSTVPFATSPTLTTPVIGDFTTAQHNHSNAATGGTLPAAAPAAHAASHQHGGSDEVATATPGANAIPKADASNKLAVGWVSEVLAIADLSDATAKTGTGTVVVMDTSPTIVTPTIASFTNATHDHSNAAGGAQIPTAGIADDAVTYAKIQNVTDARVLGRAAGSAGDVQELSAGSGITIAAGTISATGGGGTVTSVSGTAPISVATGTTTPVVSLDADGVTFAFMQEIATDRLIGRDTAATGNPEELTVTGGVEFTGAGGIQRSALTGDVTASAGSNTTLIPNDTVTYAKIQNVSATDKVLGRSTAGAGDVEEIPCTSVGRVILASTTAVVPGVPFHAPAGSVGAPSLSFSGDPDTGIYGLGSDFLAVVSGGVNTLQVSPADIRTTVPIYLPEGTAAAPPLAFVSDSDTGILRTGAANQFSLVTGGAERLRIADAAITPLVPLVSTTLTTPTIASFTNATHSHQNAAGGGALDTAAITTGTFATARYADDSVTFDKTQNIATARVLGRTTASPGNIEELSAGTGITIAGGTISVSGGSGTVTNVTGTAPISVATGTTTPVVSLDDNGVSNAKLRDSTALTVIGRSANSTGDPADIAAGTDGHVLRRSGTTLGFGQVALSGLPTIAAERLLGQGAGAGGTPIEIAVSGNVSWGGGEFKVGGTLLAVTLLGGSGTHIFNDAANLAVVFCRGGGAGGGGAAQAALSTAAGAGGGGGASAFATYNSGVTSASVDYTCGAGGAGGAAGNNAGSAGGNTSFDDTDALGVGNPMVANGGSGGAGMAAGTVGAFSAGGAGAGIGAGGGGNNRLGTGGIAGQRGIRLTGTVASSGSGGGEGGGVGLTAEGAGTAANSNGAAGAGGLCLGTTARAGGGGGGGYILVYEYS